MYVQRNTEERSRNHCCSGRKITITCSKFVSVALVMQHVMSMRRIAFSSVACLAVLYFFPSAVLQIGSSLVRFQMVSLEFFLDIILPIALWLWGRLSL